MIGQSQAFDKVRPTGSYRTWLPGLAIGRPDTGRTIDFAEVEEMCDRQGLLDFLREEVYRLAQENGAA